MAETMRGNKGEIEKWHWYDIMADLEKTGLGGVIINPLSVEPGFCSGILNEKQFTMTWQKDLFMLVSMKEDDQSLSRLVDALSKVVEYKPFCKYIDLGGISTYEWDKKNPEQRYKQIQTEGKKDIVVLR